MEDNYNISLDNQNTDTVSITVQNITYTYSAIDLTLVNLDQPINSFI